MYSLKCEAVMKLSVNTTDACINTGFFPGCIPENFVFGNDLKVDVRTGKAISDGLFGNDDQAYIDKNISNYENKVANNAQISDEEKMRYYESLMMQGKELSDEQYADLTDAHNKLVIESDKEYTKKIQESYNGGNVRDSHNNPNNVKEINPGSEEYNSRMAYYSTLLNNGDNDIYDILDSGKPVIIGESDKGAGVITTDVNGRVTGDTYNDRITVLTLNSEGEVVISEFNRGNVDPSGKYESVRSGKNKSVAAGEYDFIVGMHTPKGESYKALNVFDINNVNRLPETARTDFLDDYNNNSLSYNDVKGFDDYGFRVLPAVNNGTQNYINMHLGTNSYTDSEGCFSIFTNDYNRFINKFPVSNRLGKIFLYR